MKEEQVRGLAIHLADKLTDKWQIGNSYQEYDEVIFTERQEVIEEFIYNSILEHLND